ncbi:uncharacterized protein LOC123007726 [Tribolium madens]|uniref:uncharacterized protein LOC123007726 n=1 Tax=Tribolium madens TaxID=41895 RepID=UPI001CF73B36|nr:uncharacterized protein LOC123007726 [Tribolium madens]
MKMCNATLIQVISLCLAVQIVQTFSFHHSNITRREAKECPRYSFACKSGECIDEDKECDGGVDCKDASDESNACARIKCPTSAFRCDYGACITADLECDGKPDCRDGSDEKTPNCKIIDDTSPKCKSNEFRCSSGECIDEDNKCDGIAQCSDRSDEIKATCWNLKCPNYSYKCKYGACVNGNAQCNGQIECQDGSDEDPNICKNTTVGPVPTPAPPPAPRPGAKGSCLLPHYPDSGTWEVFGAKDLSPGSWVGPGTILNVNCRKGYKLEGNSVIYCNNEEWTENIGVCLKLCSPLESTRVMTVTCTYPNNKGEGNCSNAIDGTLARFKCEPLYEDPNLQRIPGRICRDGSWDNSSPECVPVCGQKSVEAQKLIVNGKTAKRGTYPWQVALYSRQNKDLICGGSLIKLNMIITAAHCVTDSQERAQPIPKENYIVAVGKYYRKFDDPRDSKEAQFSDVRKIIVNEKYGGPIQNFGSDIALLVTSSVFVPSLRVQPVCMDWNHQFKPGEDQVFGYVTGWGYTVEGSKPSEELKELKVPLIPESKCRKELPDNYDRYYTYDKLCAGYLNNNTAVCRGDSGGGLVVKRNGDRYYLTGVVSLSPTSPREADGCDSNQYGLYTKVAAHTEDFILKKVTEYGINARVSGWGYTVEYKNPSKVLRELKVPIITNDQCDSDLPEDYQKFMTDDKICAGFLNTGTSVCSGDSGGALVTEFKSRYYAVGIVSLSPQAPTEEGGCDSQQYTLFTSVYYYINELIFEKEARYRPSLSEIAICEEDSNCQPEHLTTTTTTTTTTPKPVTKPSTPSCVLPQHPVWGQWSIYGVQTQFSPGQFVSPATVLQVTCQKNYKLEGNNLLICHNGEWSPEIGTCLRICPPVRSTPSTIITCTYKNNATDCDSPPDGTVAKYTCAPFYESTETTKNPVRVCKNGSWDLSKPECVPICGKKNVKAQLLIVNGRGAISGEHPWQVAIYRDKRFICGGALIGENIILTAAHCVRSQNREGHFEDFIVGVGKNSVRFEDISEVYAQYSGLQDIIVPKQFNGIYTNLMADIAILVSKKNFTMSQAVQPVCLDWANSIDFKKNSKGYITGWGYTSQGSTPAQNLQELEVLIVSNNDCRQFLSEGFLPQLTFDKICAGDPTNNASACNGDAGGPLVVKHDGRYYITGIVSSAEADSTNYRCKTDQYGLFINVTEYKSFILETIAKYNPSSNIADCDHENCPPPKPELPPQKSGCVLPKHPDFGKWSLLAPSSLSPGMSVSVGTLLQVTCQNKYKLDGNSIILCDEGHWSSEIGKCLRTCPSVLSTPKLHATCVFKGKESDNCTDPIEGTQVKYQCAPYYEDPTLSQNRVGNCEGGLWDRQTPSCVPICGVKSVQAQQLIIGGNVVKKGEYPWVVAIYHGPQKDFICSGNLISEKIILTAATCVTDSEGKLRDKKDFAVAVGKYYQDFTDSREKISNVQFSAIDAIHVPEFYRGVVQNFYGDVAVLETMKSFTFTQTVQPVCVDFSTNYDNRNGSTGFVTGWGFTSESGGVSEALKDLQVPLVSTEECKTELPPEFQKFLLSDKLCAGYRNNGTSVCRGDSGGGLVVKSSTTGRYYLAGILSVAPTGPSGGCNSQQYALYTRISFHNDFLSGKIK